MGADDAVHDGQAEADAGVLVGAYAFRSALEGFGEGRYQFRREPAARVLDPQHARVAVRLGVDRHGAAGGEVVDDGVLDEVRHHPQQELRGAAGPGRPTGDVERDPALFGEGKERFGGFLGHEGEVDALGAEVSAVAAAEQQEGLGEVDRPRVDGLQAFDEFAPVPRGVLAGDVEERPRDRQGVRSSWEAFAANRCCSAMWDSSCPSIESNASESSRNSSWRPDMWIRWESDPFPAVRAASLIWVSGASIRPARSHPPTRPNTSRKTIATAAAGAKVCTKR